MSPDFRILDRNLEALLKRAYVPVLPHPDFRAELMRLVKGEVKRRRGAGRARSVGGGGRLLRFALPAAAAAAALLIWLAGGPDEGASEPTAPTAGELVARGDVAVRFWAGPGGEPSWRAATAQERTQGLALRASARELEVQTPAQAAIGVRTGSGAADAGTADLGADSHARFARLPSPDYGEAGPGHGAELVAGRLRVDLAAGARPWWLRTESGLLFLAPGSALDLWRDGGRTWATLLRGSAELERAGGARALELGVESSLDRELVASGDTGGRREPLEVTQPAAGEGSPAEVDEAAPTTELRRAALVGRVTDAEGEPIERFRVLMLLDREVPEVDLPEVRDYTAEDGAFVWDDRAPDRYEVFVEAPGFGQHRAGILTLTDGDPVELDVALQPGRPLRGWVLDARTEAPIPGAAVVVESESPTYVLPFDLDEEPDWLRGIANTGDGGSFRFESLSAGTHRVRVTADGYAPAWASVDVRATGVDAELIVRLEAGGDVRGRVVGSGGVPLEGAVLLATLAQDPAGSRLFSYEQTRTDAEGRYAFRDLAPGFFMIIEWDSVELFEGGGAPELRPVFVTRGEVATLDFRKDEATVRLTGRFLGARGEPRPYQKFTVIPVGAVELGDADGWQASATEADGSYAVELAEHGDFLVFATFGMGETLTLVDELHVPGDVRAFERDVRFSSARVAGTVRRADDGTPVPRAGVVLLRIADSGDGEFAGRGVTDEDGSFELGGMPPGRYLINAGAPTATDLGQGASAPFEVTAGGPAPAVELSLPAGGALALRVVDPAGEPIRGARARLSGAGRGEIVLHTEPLTGADGRLDLPSVPAGTWTVTVTRAGFAPVTTTTEVNASEGGRLVFTLQPLD